MLEPAIDVSWGGYTVTLTAIFGLSKMVQSSDNWDYFINLSASDFPLLPQVLLTITSNKRICPFSFAWRKLATPLVSISILHYLTMSSCFCRPIFTAMIVRIVITVTCHDARAGRVDRGTRTVRQRRPELRGRSTPQ